MGSPLGFGIKSSSNHPEREKNMTVSRRAFALGTAAMAAVAALPAYAQSNLSAEDRAVLARAQSYLQNLTSAQGTFVETSGAQRREGRFYLQRPGRMRFEYTNPAGLLVVSDGSNVKRYDPRLEVFRQVPLGQTPLSTFLARTVRLDQGVRIDRVTRMASGAFAITARDRKASTSYIQRRLQIGYNRAASLIERMEQEGVVSPANHAGKRDILAGPPPM